MQSEDGARLDLKRSLTTAPLYAWLVLGVVWLAGIAAPLNQFKVPPVMTLLMKAYALDLTAAGWLMSVFAIMGLLLALPAGYILQKVGVRLTGLVALSCLFVGSLLGVLTSQAWLLFVSRLVEGCGMGLIAVLAPAVISAWFPPEKRGLPLGIWATWVSMGSLLIYNIAPFLNAGYGWQSVWWFGAFYTLLVLVLYGLVVRLPQTTASAAPADRPAGNFFQSLANANIWLLSFAFACFNGVVIGAIATYYPTFLTTTQHYSLSNASLITSLKMIVVITTAPLIGWICDRIASPKKVLLISTFLLGIFSLFPFSSSGWTIPILMALLGLLAGAIPTACFSFVAEIMGSPHKTGMGMAVLMIGQNLGQLVTPLFFSQLVEHFGWSSAGYSLILLCAAAVLSIVLIKTRQNLFN
ncbi:MAG: MFS transporter [Anaerolineae bacterium]|nr:MFS transporter [Anaerolineae bacterium]